MRNTIVGTLVAIGAATANQIAVAEPIGDPRGLWLTEAGDAKVQVTKCGEALCGTIVWLKTPIDNATGKPQVDDKNPNPRLRSVQSLGSACFST